MKTRFYNAKILTSENLDIVSGELWVDGSIISYIGEPTETLPKFDFQFDCKNNLLIPGFKNGHSHSPMSFLRSLADDLPLSEWLTKKVFPMEAKLTEEDVYWCSLLSILEFLSGGITSSFDMYFHQRSVIQAYIDSGFRGVFCSGANSIISQTDKVFLSLLNEYDNWNKLSPRITYQLGFHAEYTTPKPMLKEICHAIEHLKAPSYTHLLEGSTEREDCFLRNKEYPVQYLTELGFWKYGGGAFHAIHVLDNEIDILKSKNVGIITNPSCNAKLASGVIPLAKYLDKGLMLGIGTDGAASNNSQDMFKEMFMSVALLKLQQADAAAGNAKDILKMATVGSAKVMRLDDCSCLAVGKKADLALINLFLPNMQPENNLISNLVYAGNKQNVLLTMVDGKTLYKNGEFYIGIDSEAIYRKVNSIIKRIKDAL